MLQSVLGLVALRSVQVSVLVLVEELALVVPVLVEDHQLEPELGFPYRTSLFLQPDPSSRRHSRSPPHP